MRRIALPLIAGLALFYVIMPILVVVPLSFSSASYLSFPPPGFSLRWYRNFFTRADWLSSAWLSLWVGLAVTVLATTLGTPAAVALVRGKKPASTTTRFNGKKQVPTVALPVTWITKANVSKLYKDKFIKKSDVCVGDYAQYC